MRSQWRKGVICSLDMTLLDNVKCLSKGLEYLNGLCVYVVQEAAVT